jgi:hypothetical protein
MLKLVMEELAQASTGSQPSAPGISASVSASTKTKPSTPNIFPVRVGMKIAPGLDAVFDFGVGCGVDGFGVKAGVGEVFGIAQKLMKLAAAALAALSFSYFTFSLSIEKTWYELSPVIGTAIVICIFVLKGNSDGSIVVELEQPDFANVLCDNQKIENYHAAIAIIIRDRQIVVARLDNQHVAQRLTVLVWVIGSIGQVRLAKLSFAGTGRRSTHVRTAEIGVAQAKRPSGIVSVEDTTMISYSSWRPQSHITPQYRRRMYGMIVGSKGEGILILTYRYHTYRREVHIVV